MNNFTQPQNDALRRLGIKEAYVSKPLEHPSPGKTPSQVLGALRSCRYHPYVPRRGYFQVLREKLSSVDESEGLGACDMVVD
ncbi:hypothetical protein C0995_002460 [Termitomyces sp. Mi166|nr:hypothetical protein C0995_002460 [Termitomyces sp. Mi166\